MQVLWRENGGRYRKCRYKRHLRQPRIFRPDSGGNGIYEQEGMNSAVEGVLDMLWGEGKGGGGTYNFADDDERKRKRKGLRR